MKLERIYLQNYTNYEGQDYTSDRMLNILMGENAQGKSNLLDSIYYLSRGSSSRYSKDAEIIRWGTDFFRIRARVQSHGMDRDITIAYHQGKKSLEVDGSMLQKNAQLMGVFNTVLFSPDDLFMVKGSPERRRKFLDDELMQTDPVYYEESNRYRKILQQRNNLLKKMKNGNPGDRVLDVLDEQLSRIGTFITENRMTMLERIQPLARLVQRKLTNGVEELGIEYLCYSRANPEDKGQPTDQESVYRLLTETRKEDISRGYTTRGPHRDDFRITINGMDVKAYGSQGQQRTVALSLKIAEIEFLKALTGEYPVLLLDDVLSELDGGRRSKLLEIVSQNIQTFITCTELDHLDEELKEKATIQQIIAGRIR